MCKSHTHSSQPRLASCSKEPEEKDKSEKCFVTKVNVERLSGLSSTISSSVKIPSASNNDLGILEMLSINQRHDRCTVRVGFFLAELNIQLPARCPLIFGLKRLAH